MYKDKIQTKNKTEINAITLDKLSYAKPANTGVFIKQLKKWTQHRTARHGIEVLIHGFVCGLCVCVADNSSRNFCHFGSF